MAEQRPVTATLRVIINGYAADLEATGTLEDLVGLTSKLERLGIQPGNSPLLWKGGANGNGGNTGETDAPTCPVHHAPMRRSQKGGGWYCPRKLDDGSYCTQKA